MTLWMLVMVIFMSPAQPPEFVALSSRTEAGCQQRAQEFIGHLPAKPAAVMVKCLYMPKFMGSI